MRAIGWRWSRSAAAARQIGQEPASTDTSGKSLLNPVNLDNTNSTSTCQIIENVWYRLSLSIKVYPIPDNQTTSRLIAAGKIWWTARSSRNCSRSGRSRRTACLSPVSAACTWKAATPAWTTSWWICARRASFPRHPLRHPRPEKAIQTVCPANSRYAFPIIFRPDGTGSVPIVVQLMDMSSGDKQYVRIDQNTGRARIETDRPT